MATLGAGTIELASGYRMDCRGAEEEGAVFSLPRSAAHCVGMQKATRDACFQEVVWTFVVGGPHRLATGLRSFGVGKGTLRVGALDARVVGNALVSAPQTLIWVG